MQPFGPNGGWKGVVVENDVFDVSRCSHVEYYEFLSVKLRVGY